MVSLFGRGCVDEAGADADVMVKSADAASVAGAADADTQAEAARSAVQMADNMVLKFSFIAAVNQSVRDKLASLLSVLTVLQTAHEVQQGQKGIIAAGGVDGLVGVKHDEVDLTALAESILGAVADVRSGGVLVASALASLAVSMRALFDALADVGRVDKTSMRRRLTPSMFSCYRLMVRAGRAGTRLHRFRRLFQ